MTCPSPRAHDILPAPGPHSLVCYMLTQAVNELKALRDRGAIIGTDVNRQWFDDGSEYGIYETPEDVEDLLEFFKDGTFTVWAHLLGLSVDGCTPEACLSMLGFRGGADAH